MSICDSGKGGLEVSWLALPNIRDLAAFEMLGRGRKEGIEVAELTPFMTFVFEAVIYLYRLATQQ